MAATSPSDAFTAIVLAGQRGANDPIVAQSGASCKALVEIDGRPMVLRVLETLGLSSAVRRVLLSGPTVEQLQVSPEVQCFLDSDSVEWHAPAASPSTSAHQLMMTLPTTERVLVTTADHPLLSADIVNEFCDRSIATGADVVVGLAPYALVRQVFPDMKKTVLRFGTEEFCGCNLFAFLSPEARAVADFWRQVEAQRKNPLKVIGLLGWSAVLRYRLGRLSLDDGLRGLSRRLGLRVSAVVLPHAHAAVDVDSLADFQQVERRLRCEREGSALKNGPEAGG